MKNSVIDINTILLIFVFISILIAASNSFASVNYLPINASAVYSDLYDLPRGVTLLVQVETGSKTSNNHNVYGIVQDYGSSYASDPHCILFQFREWWTQDSDEGQYLSLIDADSGESISELDFDQCEGLKDPDCDTTPIY